MANGTTKRIADVEVGDEVLATDPETEETGAREVLATLPHTDQLLTLRTSSGEIVTTEDHKYWNVTDQAWQEGQDLDEGDRLFTADGDEVKVLGLDWSTVHTAPAYDLTIDELHTFYVAAGDDEVLVHNCKERGLWQITKEGTARTARHDRFGTFSKSKSDGLWWSKDQAGHGKSAWKVFEERGDGLHWIADADEFGTFIGDKYKGPTGQFIPWKELHG